MIPPVRFSRAALLAATALVSAPLCLSVNAGGPPSPGGPVLPNGGSFVAGSGSMARSGGSLTIRQSTPTAVIDWRGFSIGPNNSVAIQNGSGATMNRVTGASPSTIAGGLSATGSAYLLNPNGIVVTPSGRVVTGGDFTASTLGADPASLGRGGPVTLSGSGRAGVRNEGTIISRQGNVALIGRDVSNSGSIAAPNGTANLIAARVVLTEPGGDGHVRVELPAGDVTNTGAIAAAQARLSAAGGNIYALSGNNGGLIQATGTIRRGGRVWLSAGGDTTVTGTIAATSQTSDPGAVAIRSGGSVTVAGTVQATSRGGMGGRVRANGAQVALRDARIDVSGDTGGGSIALGGQKASPTAARAVEVDAASLLTADARGSGDGGSVLLWSTESTRFLGTIQARGGSAGKGGQVEVSSAGVLTYAGLVNLSGGAGPGHLLLDPPTSVTIETQGGDPALFPPGGSLVDPAALVAALDTAGVTIEAGTGGIAVRSPVRWATASGLTLTTLGGIEISAPLTQTAPIGTTGTIALIAGGDVHIRADITGTGGRVNLLVNANTGVEGGGITVGGFTGAPADFLTGGAVPTGAPVTLSLTGDITLGGGRAGDGSGFTNGFASFSYQGAGIALLPGGTLAAGGTVALRGRGADVSSLSPGPGAGEGVIVSPGARIVAVERISLSGVGGAALPGSGGTDALALNIGGVVGGPGQSAPIDLTGDRMAITGGVTSTGRVALTPGSPVWHVDLGSTGKTAAATLELSAADLGAINAGTLAVSATGGNAVFLSADLDLRPVAGVTALTAPGGDIAQTGGTLSAAVLSLDARAISLTAGGNAIGTMAARATDTLDINTGTALTVGTVEGIAGVSATTLTLRAGGTITLDAPVTAAGPGDALILTGAGLVNNAGANALVTPAADARWLVFAPTRDAIQANGLHADNWFGRPYPETAETSPGAGVGPGHRFVIARGETLTVTPGAAGTVYGVPAAPGVSVTGLVTGDTLAAALTGTAAVTGGGTDAGTYTLVAGPGSLVSPENYTLRFGTSTLTVAPAPLTVTAQDRTKTAGQAVNFAGTEFTVQGLLGGDTVRTVSLSSTGQDAGAGTAGSPYAILASAAQGTGLSNYRIGYAPGRLFVTDPPPVVTPPVVTPAVGTASGPETPVAPGPAAVPLAGAGSGSASGGGGVTASSPPTTPPGNAAAETAAATRAVSGGSSFGALPDRGGDGRLYLAALTDTAPAVALRVPSAPVIVSDAAPVSLPVASGERAPHARADRFALARPSPLSSPPAPSRAANPPVLVPEEPPPVLSFPSAVAEPSGTEAAPPATSSSQPRIADTAPPTLAVEASKPDRAVLVERETAPPVSPLAEPPPALSPPTAVAETPKPDITPPPIVTQEVTPDTAMVEAPKPRDITPLAGTVPSLPESAAPPAASPDVLAAVPLATTPESQAPTVEAVPPGRMRLAGLRAPPSPPPDTARRPRERARGSWLDGLSRGDMGTVRETTREVAASSPARDAAEAAFLTRAAQLLSAGVAPDQAWARAEWVTEQLRAADSRLSPPTPSQILADAAASGEILPAGAETRTALARLAQGMGPEQATRAAGTAMRAETATRAAAAVPATPMTAAAGLMGTGGIPGSTPDLPAFTASLATGATPAAAWTGAEAAARGRSNQTEQATLPATSARQTAAALASGDAATASPLSSPLARAAFSQALARGRPVAEALAVAGRAEAAATGQTSRAATPPLPSRAMSAACRAALATGNVPDACAARSAADAQRAAAAVPPWADALALAEGRVPSGTAEEAVTGRLLRPLRDPERVNRVMSGWSAARTRQEGLMAAGEREEALRGRLARGQVTAEDIDRLSRFATPRDVARSLSGPMRDGN